MRSGVDLLLYFSPITQHADERGIHFLKIQDHNMSYVSVLCHRTHTMIICSGYEYVMDESEKSFSHSYYMTFNSQRIRSGGYLLAPFVCGAGSKFRAFKGAYALILLT